MGKTVRNERTQAKASRGKPRGSHGRHHLSAKGGSGKFVDLLAMDFPAIPDIVKGVKSDSVGEQLHYSINTRRISGINKQEAQKLLYVASMRSIIRIAETSHPVVLKVTPFDTKRYGPRRMSFIVPRGSSLSNMLTKALSQVGSVEECEFFSKASKSEAAPKPPASHEVEAQSGAGDITIPSCGPEPTTPLQQIIEELVQQALPVDPNSSVSRHLKSHLRDYLTPPDCDWEVLDALSDIDFDVLVDSVRTMQHDSHAALRIFGSTRAGEIAPWSNFFETFYFGSDLLGMADTIVTAPVEEPVSSIVIPAPPYVDPPPYTPNNSVTSDGPTNEGFISDFDRIFDENLTKILMTDFADIEPQMNSALRGVDDGWLARVIRSVADPMTASVSEAMAAPVSRINEQIRECVAQMHANATAAASHFTSELSDFRGSAEEALQRIAGATSNASETSTKVHKISIAISFCLICISLWRTRCEVSTLLAHAWSFLSMTGVQKDLGYISACIAELRGQWSPVATAFADGIQPQVFDSAEVASFAISLLTLAGVSTIASYRKANVSKWVKEFGMICKGADGVWALMRKLVDFVKERLCEFQSGVPASVVRSGFKIPDLADIYESVCYYEKPDNLIRINTPNVAREVIDLCAKFSEYKRQSAHVKLLPAARDHLHDLNRRIEALKSAINLQGLVNGAKRQTPAGVLFMGAPGTGKTSIISYINMCIAMLEGGMSKSEASESLAYRARDKNFNTCYHGQYGYLHDEMLQEADTVGGTNSEPVEIIALLNNGPCEIPGASIQDKGKLFSSKVVYLTTNSETHNLPSLNNANALYRRFDIVIEPVVREQYRQPGTQRVRISDTFEPNTHFFKIGQYKLEDRVNNPKVVWEREANGDLKFLELREVISRIIAIIKRYSQAYMAYLKSAAEMDPEHIPTISGDVTEELAFLRREHDRPTVQRPQAPKQASLTRQQQRRAKPPPVRDRRKLKRSTSQQDEGSPLPSDEFLNSIRELEEVLPADAVIEGQGLLDVFGTQVPEAEKEEEPTCFAYVHDTELELDQITEPQAEWLFAGDGVHTFEDYVDPQVHQDLSMYWQNYRDIHLLRLQINPSLFITEARSMNINYYETCRCRQAYLDASPVLPAPIVGRRQKIAAALKQACDKYKEWKHRELFETFVTVIAAVTTAVAGATMLKRMFSSSEDSEKEEFVDHFGDVIEGESHDWWLARNQRVRTAKRTAKQQAAFKRGFIPNAGGKGPGEDTADVVANNTYSVYAYTGDPARATNETGSRFCFTTFVGGNISIMPWHCIKAVLEQDKVVLRRAQDRGYIVDVENISVERLTTPVGDDVDVGLVLWRGSAIPPRRDLRSHLTKSESLQRLFCVSAILPFPGQGNRLYPQAKIIATTKRYSAQGEDLHLIGGLSYEAHTQKGDCGLPVIIANAKFAKKWCGVHVAGVTNHGLGLAQFTSYEMVEKAHSALTAISPQAHFDLGLEVDLDNAKYPMGTHYEGIAPFKVNTSSRNSLEPSVLFDALARNGMGGKGPVWKNEVGPTRMGSFEVEPGIWRHVVEIANDKLGHIGPVFEPNDLFDEATQHLQRYVAGMEGFRERPLTMIEALYGVPGAEFLKGMKRNTSPGWPWTLESDGMLGKTKWFGPADEPTPWVHPDLEAAVNHRIAEAKQGRRTPTYWVDMPKGEKRPFAKLDAGKTRVFSCGPLDYLVAVRMYMGSFIEALLNDRIVNGHAAGMTPEEVPALVTLLLMKGSPDQCIAGDQKSFDASIVPEFWDVICELPVIFNPLWDEEDILVLRTLLLEVKYPVHVWGKSAFSVFMKNPSGFLGTEACNTLYHRLINDYAVKVCLYQARIDPALSTDVVGFVALGDDQIQLVSKGFGEAVNAFSLRDAFAELGHTFTDDNKGDFKSPFRSLTECTFLGRRFVKRFDWEAVLDLQTIKHAILWVHRSGDPSVAVMENIEGMKPELALHDKHVYNRVVSEIRSAATTCSPPLAIAFRSYEEQRAKS